MSDPPRPGQNFVLEFCTIHREWFQASQLEDFSRALNGFNSILALVYLMWPYVQNGGDRIA